MTDPRSTSDGKIRFVIHSKRRESGIMQVHFTAFRGEEVIDTTIEKGRAFRFKDPRQVQPAFMAALEGPIEEGIPLSALPCQANPTLFGTGDPTDLGFGMEPHYHQCPNCYGVWRHLRPVLETGEGWGMDRALSHMKEEKRQYGRSTYEQDAHRCQGCGYGPVFPWARGPIAPALMDGFYYPMKCA